MSDAAPPANLYFQSSASTPMSMTLQIGNPKPALVIQADGRVFWRGHEVKSDAEFRRIMKDFLAYFQHGCKEPKQ